MVSSSVKKAVEEYGIILVRMRRDVARLESLSATFDEEFVQLGGQLLDGEPWPDGTEELAAKLDAIGLPVHVTHKEAKAALASVGAGVRSLRLSAAIRWRKRQLPPPELPFEADGNAGGLKWRRMETLNIT